MVKPALAVRGAVARAHARMAPPFAAVVERTNALIEAKALAVAVELRVPDALHAGPRTANDLARELDVDPDALDRLLGFLAACGLLGRRRDGRYENNAVSDVLRADHPESVRDWPRFMGAKWQWEIWNQLPHSVATGADGTRAAHGVPYFEYVNEANPRAGETFNRALAQLGTIMAPLIAGGYDFSSVRRVCDVGGGTGTLLAEILPRHPSMRGVLFELESLHDDARANLAARGVAGRCDVVAGDFFTSVPDGCDVYVLQAVLHDWDDERATTILTNVREAMAPGARLLVIENLLDADGREKDRLTRGFDLLMLVLTGSGRERTREQFEALFARAGLRLERDITLPSLLHVLEVAAPG
jgi:SAM-dependent methyltransferase